VYATGHQTGKVRHVHQVDCSDLVGDLAHPGKINNPRVGAAAADDQLRAFLLGELFQVVVIDGFSFLGHAVGDNAIGLAGKIQMMTMSKVSAMSEVEAENGIPGLNNRRVRRHVRLRPRVRLDVGVFCAKQFLGTVARQVFHYVSEFATAVIALCGIPLGIFVCKHRAHRFKYGLADEVLRGDQFQAVVLAANFIVDRSGDFGIDFVQRARHAVLSFHCAPPVTSAPASD
jgi:hypothetical protein